MKLIYFMKLLSANTRILPLSGIAVVQMLSVLNPLQLCTVQGTILMSTKENL